MRQVGLLLINVVARSNTSKLIVRAKTIRLGNSRGTIKMVASIKSNERQNF